MSALAAAMRDRRVLRVTWPDGFSRDFGAHWLFDHADDARDPVSGQRGGGAAALDGLAIETAGIDDAAVTLRFRPAGLQRRIALARLRGLEAPPARAAELWTTPEPIAAAEPVAFEDYLQDDEALSEALSRVVRHGLALLSGAGQDPGVVEQAVARFGFVRETNYGRTFDVRIEPKPGNLAFSGQGLDLHTDNPYRDPVPTLQLLHAIIADGLSGETLFVDGFAQAEALRREAPTAFDVLVREPVRFTYAAASGERWSTVHPVLTLGPRGGLEAVRMNHRSLDLEPEPAEAVEAWYDAYFAYYRRAHAPEAAFERRLQAGEVVIFDNRRILHGRRTLTEGSPRWLRGCYADSDGLAATLCRLDLKASQEARDASRLHR